MSHEDLIALSITMGVVGLAAMCYAIFTTWRAYRWEVVRSQAANKVTEESWSVKRENKRLKRQLANEESATLLGVAKDHIEEVISNVPHPPLPSRLFPLLNIARDAVAEALDMLLEDLEEEES